jgi:hypothetical protein
VYQSELLFVTNTPMMLVFGDVPLAVENREAVAAA